MPLLDMQNISVRYRSADGGWRRAVDNVSLCVNDNEIVGLVGESGCGKTTLARAAMRLTPIASGSVLVDGRDITHASRRELRPVRSVVQMVFQDPFSSLNPRMTAFDTLAEPLRLHRRVSRGSAMTGAVDKLLTSVGLAGGDAHKYPHEFSGGQRQRIAIARCLAVRPRLIIADEPVSSLDVSVQAQILNLLSDLCRNTGMALLFISHDLAVVRYLSQRIAVMHDGRIVEEGKTSDVFGSPKHAYTRKLLDAIPRISGQQAAERVA